MLGGRCKSRLGTVGVPLTFGFYQSFPVRKVVTAVDFPNLVLVSGPPRSLLPGVGDASTGATSPTVEHDRIFRRHRVALGARRLGSLSPVVLSGCHGFQMVGVDTCGRKTQMVDVQAGRRRPVDAFVDEPVCVRGSSLSIDSVGDDAVPILFTVTLPDPTSNVIDDVLSQVHIEIIPDVRCHAGR